MKSSFRIEEKTTVKNENDNCKGFSHGKKHVAPLEKESRYENPRYLDPDGRKFSR
jgi:hypothetical protein